jgi:hypothetical protein
MEKKITNLKEKVYLLLYNEPKYKANISTRLYKKESKTIDRIFKELEGDKWIQEKKTSVNRVDGRSWSQKNYIANPEPLLNSICQDLKEMQTRFSIPKKKIDIELTNAEREKLLHLFDSKVFRAFVGDLVNKVERIDGIDHPSFCFFMVKNQLSSYCAFTLWFEIYYIFNETRDKNEFDKINKQINKKYGAMTNFADISEGVLSLGFRMIEKLTYLDYRNSGTLLLYLNKVPSLLSEASASMSILEKNPLSEFPPVDDLLDSLMFHRGYKSPVSL